MADITLKMRPWKVPNFATVADPAGRREEGLIAPRSIPVADLPASTLRQMAHEWLTDLYDKAGQPYDFRFE